MAEDWSDKGLQHPTTEASEDGGCRRVRSSGDPTQCLDSDGTVGQQSSLVPERTECQGQLSARAESHNGISPKSRVPGRLSTRATDHWRALSVRQIDC